MSRLYKHFCLPFGYIEMVRNRRYGMREFSIRDLNGYFLTFAQRME